MLNEIDVGGLKSKMENSAVAQFYSLVDYKNALFTSNNMDDIVDFYNSFKDREQLIQWMKERPKGVNHICEVEGTNEVVVVIPTANYNGKYALECKENIFKGLRMVFIESGGRDDFYFNYAHNCNLGVKKALEYDPKWVIISNDDVFRIDDLEILLDGLRKLEEDKPDAVFVSSGVGRHSNPLSIVKLNRHLVSIATKVFRLLGKDSMLYRFGFFYRKFDLSYYFLPTNRHWMKCISQEVATLKNIEDFAIFSPRFLRKKGEELFDEVFLNGPEDIEVSLTLKDCRTESIVFSIGSYFSASLGTERPRKLRSISNRAYFNEKLESGRYPLRNVK